LLQPNTTLHIEEVVVDEAYRRRGVARILIGGVEEYAAKVGITRISLNVWKFNGPAEHLYLELGYTVQRSIMEKDL
jgi:ribosomal protein S18 acetylase RimI-like enzyme